MTELSTARLRLTPFSLVDFERFVTEMLVDPRVVQHYHAYDHDDEVAVLRRRAHVDFWDHFQESRASAGLEVWAAYRPAAPESLVGWSGLLRTSLSEEHNAPELQYMIAGDAHGMGYATEMASAVLDHAKRTLGITEVIGVVDIPNIGSIRVLEKLGFSRAGQIEAYGSKDMFLYERTL